MINEIKSLVDFVNKCKVQHLEIFTREDFGKKKTKMGEMFELIRDLDLKTEDDLKTALYGDKILAYGFDKIYSRFQEKLSNTLFFIDTRTSLFSERAIAYYNCSRRAYITRILLERGYHKFSISLVEKTLPVSLKFEFTDLSVHFLKLLIRHYSTRTIDLKKFEKYKTRYLPAVQTLHTENRLEIMVANIAYESNAAHVARHSLIPEDALLDSVETSESLLKGEASIDSIMAASKILQYYFKQNKNYGEYKKITAEALKKISAKPFRSVITIESLIHAQLIMTLVTRDVPSAEAIRSEYFNRINTGNFNWYVIHYYYALTLMHGKAYQKAYEVIQFILNYKTFGKQPPVIRENFYVLQAYTEFLLKIGRILPVEEALDFRLNKFLNQVPEYSKDKQGVNISIILIQVLYFLADRKYTRIIDRMESLNLYAYRHLKRDESFRSQSFIRMLGEMVRADFRKKGTLFRTEKLSQNLKNTAIDAFPDAAEAEIIPYEDLWALILDQLD